MSLNSFQQFHYISLAHWLHHLLQPTSPSHFLHPAHHNLGLLHLGDHEGHCNLSPVCMVVHKYVIGDYLPGFYYIFVPIYIPSGATNMFDVVLKAISSEMGLHDVWLYRHDL